MDNIVQFECFETELPFEDFITHWEPLANKLAGDHLEITLHERLGGNNKYRFISKHNWPESYFSFRFMKGRNSDFFNQHYIKITQAGGYMPLQLEYQNDEISPVYEKIMLLLPLKESNIEQFKMLPFHRYLNIYQSYYESCIFSYILEFFVPGENCVNLQQWLNENRYVQDVGLYRECSLLPE